MQLKIFIEDVVSEANNTSELQYLEGIKVEGNVLKNVHLVGLQAKNKEKGKDKPYTYKEEALKEAVTNYDGVDVNINHDKKNIANRNTEDKIGFVKNPVFKEGKGVYGDIVLNEGHLQYNAIKWWAENNPAKLGASHVAGVVYSEAENAVTKVGKVYSVDIVSSPSTTNGLFTEGVVGDKVQQITEDDKLSVVTRAVMNLTYESIYSLEKTLTAKEKAVKLKQIYEDAVVELDKLFPVKQESTTKEQDMDWKDITLESLKANRKDLADKVAAEAIAAENALTIKVSEAVKDLPESAKTPVFLKLVTESIRNGNDPKDLIEDRKLVAKETPRTTVQESVSGDAGKKPKNESKITEESVKNLFK